MVSARVYKILGFALIILGVFSIYGYWRDLIAGGNLLVWVTIFLFLLLSIIYLITGYKGRENKYTNLSIYLLFLLIFFGIYIPFGILFGGFLGPWVLFGMPFVIIVLSIILSVVGLFQKSSE